MRCPFCNAEDSRVIDSRSADDGNAIRRRRECIHCSRRFTTFEVVEEIPFMVIKSDGRRVPFERKKIIDGIMRSCHKCSVSVDAINDLVNKIEKELRNTLEREVSSRRIGELVLEYLKDFNEVAYVRFASVYRKFADADSFMQELRRLTDKQERTNEEG